MTLIKTVLLLFLISFSSLVFADQYNATKQTWWSYSSYTNTTSLSSFCDHFTSATMIVSISSVRPNDSCQVLNVSNGLTGDPYITANTGVTYSCPYGGTLSGTLCINAPTCLSPMYRLPSGQCVTPVTCNMPQILDVTTNTCKTKTCPYPQVLMGADYGYACSLVADCPASPPICSTPGYTCNNSDGTQKTIPTCNNVCPSGQHMVGNTCLADNKPPVQCPPNFVAVNGSCEAVPPAACDAGYRRGYVNGEAICVAAGSQQPGVDPNNADRQTHNTGSSTGSQTTTTTNKDASGNVTGTSTSTTTTSSNIDLNTTGLATESTMHGILDSLVGNGSQSSWSSSSTGSGPSFSDVDGQVSAAQSSVRDQFNAFKSSLSGLITPLTGGGGISCDEGFTLSNGVHASICFSQYSSLFAKIGTVVLFVSTVFSVLMVLS